jgi:two-component system response regulator RegA
VSQTAEFLLVADDQEQLANVHARLFEARGWQVLRAATLVEVKSQVAGAKPKRALIEQRLPDGCGLALLRTLKAALPDIRVVILTRFASLTGAVQSMRAGAHNYLSKPVGSAQLLAAFDDQQDQGNVDQQADGRAQPNTLARMEWEFINQVLLQCEGNISQAARALGVDRRGLRRRLWRGS